MGAKKTDTMFSVRMDKSLRKLLQALADKGGRSLNSEIRMALEKHVASGKETS